MSRAPLDGIVVIDLTQIFNGPYATFMMAAAGAEVIKIEPPGGEHLRNRTVNPTSRLPYAMLNSGKKSLRLDLKQAAGREVLLRLVERADVLIENFAAGVMDRLGLGRDVLLARNPRLVCASSTGYGSVGPYRDYPAMDVTVQAMAGFIDSTGFPDGPPVKAGPAACDFLSGVHLYGAVVTALLSRERSGQAHAVEVTMLEAAYFALSSGLGMVQANGPSAVGRTGNSHGALIVCPYNVYPTCDGYLSICVNHDAHWRSLMAAIDRPELGTDPRYATNAQRVAHMAEVDALLADWTSTRARDAVFDALVSRKIPCAPVRRMDEVLADPHLHQRGSLREIDHPEYGRLTVAASPLRFDGEASLPERPSVPLGSDGRAVLRERLGLDDAELDTLERDRII